MEPRWLTLQMVLALHAETVRMFGGSTGLRDAGLLDTAMDRARNVYAYADEPSLFDLAAAYCAGIVRNHPFIDGNKRAGLLAARAFLYRNGYLFEPTEADEVALILALAAGELDDRRLARWITDYSTPKP